MQKEKEVLKEVVHPQLEKPEESGQAQRDEEKEMKNGHVQENSKDELEKEEERRIEATDPNWI